MVSNRLKKNNQTLLCFHLLRGFRNRWQFDSGVDVVRVSTKEVAASMREVGLNPDLPYCKAVFNWVTQDLKSHVTLYRVSWPWSVWLGK